MVDRKRDHHPVKADDRVVVCFRCHRGHIQ
jgi:hypothetical protein